ncbi:hypothetical protein DXA60_14040 [Roseburia sp. OF03-24]|uniref:pentapeptide repeat-containing protein n=1 Tax=Roseburia sp. OF03-24 TaxID=2292367 RepID=UPI000E548757|nr:pentapeptide repeat-containing protein [Roseburia sp. OF03-24]RGX91230.1 hypothetical protein DXA60_14040 [Roseburia sp. OF03-24]
MIEEFNDEIVKKATDNIFKHIKSDYNIRGQIGSSDNTEMPKDMRGAVFYQEIFQSGIWEETDLTNASGNGTIFRDNDFLKAKLDNVSLQYCSFAEDVFHACSFRGSNFANSTLVYCAIQDSIIHGCSYVGTEFYSGIIRNTRIDSSTFELCRFHKTILEDLDLRQVTLNYTFFDKVTMNNVCLPFLQIPYTFNGLQYVFNTSDNITVSSHSSERSELTVKEYREMINDFVVFFNDQKQYFPLVNCYIVQNKWDLALLSNETGIKTSIEKHDFRSLYFYCIQAAQILNMERKKRMLLYSEISKQLSVTYLTGGEYHQFCLYFPMIKKLLFDVPNNNPVLTMVIKTNIEPEDYKNLGILLKALDEAAALCGVSLDSKHVEIRHNSPNIIDYVSSGEFQCLLSNAASIYHLLQPFLTDFATIITIGTGAVTFGNYMKERKDSPNKKAKKKKENSYSYITKLRKELKRLYMGNGQENQKVLHIGTNVENEFMEELINVRKNLKQSGIEIAGLEIQFLNGEDDVLDSLYQRSFQAVKTED